MPRDHTRVWVFLIVLLIFVFVAFAFWAREDYSNGQENVSAGRKYIGRSIEECSRVQFMCAPDSREFRDASGCGCELISGTNVSGNIGKNSTRQLCTSESRFADVCLQLYDPVCGDLVNGDRATYSNSCFACKDYNVSSWTPGVC